MLERNVPLGKREALKQKRAQELEQERLDEHLDNNLIKQKNKLEEIERYLLKLAKLAEHNPRDYEQYELLLKPKGYLRDYD
jgi:sugar (pentulose or hexulose) kinase